MANASAPDDFPLINTPQPARPFDVAQGKPFDVAQSKPFDVAQSKPFDVAQSKPFDVAQSTPFDAGHGKHALVPAEKSWDMFVPEAKPAPVSAPPRARESSPEQAAHVPAPSVATATRKVTPPPAANNASTRRTTFRAPRVSPWIAATLGGIALMEGVVIAALLLRQPASTTPATTAAAASPIPDAASRSTTLSPAVPAVAAAVPEPKTAVLTAAAAIDPIKAAASKQRSGGVKFQTPIELKVFQGDKVFGSTADGPIIAPEGTYQVDLVNAAYGVRMSRTLTFRAGQIANLTVTIPPGRLSVNAQPWAEVSLDGQAKGETPLANLSVPVGEHEIVFRHPELGERRQTVVVRADQPARASVTFDR